MILVTGRSQPKRSRLPTHGSQIKSSTDVSTGSDDDSHPADWEARVVLLWCARGEWNPHALSGTRSLLRANSQPAPPIWI